MKIQTIRTVIQMVYALLLFTVFFISLPVFSIIILLSTILGGVFYCGWLCPFGTMQEIIGNLREFFNIKKVSVDKKIHSYLVFLRYVFFATVFFGLSYILFIDARISFIDLLNGGTLLFISYVSIVMFIVISLFIDRPFCNYFCIQGARFGIFSVARIFRIQRNEKSCINCKICDNICPMNVMISNKSQVNSLQCINCFLCVSNCPKKSTLKFSFARITLLKDNFKDFLKKIFRKD